MPSPDVEFFVTKENSILCFCTLIPIFRHECANMLLLSLLFDYVGQMEPPKFPYCFDSQLVFQIIIIVCGVRGPLRQFSWRGGLRYYSLWFLHLTSVNQINIGKFLSYLMNSIQNFLFLCFRWFFMTLYIL